MFGYVRPLKCELKMREWDLYQAAYCGLCHRLKARCGFAARFTLSYDFVFLALALAAINGEELSVCQRRCIASPVRKKSACESNPSLDFAADTSVILTYWKLRDSVNDSGFFKGIPARFAGFALKGAYKRAAKRHPDFTELVKSCLDELSKIESADVPAIDAPADTFARILSALAEKAEGENNRRIAEQIFYHLGRYIYIIDAWDDLAADLKSGSYNPVALRFGIKNTPVRDEVKQELRETLAQSISAVERAFELIDESQISGLLHNILYLGLPSMVKLVETGGFNKKEKRFNEGSI